MNSHKFKFFLFCLFFYSLSSFALDSYKNKKIELKRINGQIEQLQKKLQQDQKKQLTLQQQLQSAEITISQLSQQVGVVNSSLAREQLQLNKLKTNQQAAFKKLNQQRIALGQQFRAAYQLGRSQSLKIILNHHDPNTLARHLTYYRYLTQARMQAIADMRHTLTLLTENMNAINQQQQRLKTLLTQKQQQQNQQMQTQLVRQNLIATLNQKMVSKQQQINTLLANQKALQQLLTRLQSRPNSVTNLKPFAKLGQKLSWPVRGPIIASFGSLLDVGDQRLNGVIIKAPEGAPVRAIYPGKVIFSNWLRGFGLLVIINHGNNYMSLYARNQTVYAKTGDHVNMGDTIATAGNSGGYEKSGLYFEIRHDGTPINPASWCQ